ncbi:MAG: hypothetical protein ABIY70_02665 [Capsulimonas sp.]|uniref:hypothetical protein n=1 Tax=Capsulimonas sp. TaxID=2494211 RepID=UPI0032670DCE
MKPNHAVTFVMLCGLAAADNVISRHCMQAHATAVYRTASSQAPAPLVTYSADLRRRFLWSDCRGFPEEGYECVALIHHARVTHDLHELHLLQAAHRRHIRILLRRYIEANDPSYTHPATKHRSASQ